jgi:hypothetical protein
MDTQRFWKLIEDARAQVADPADGEAVAAQAVTLLAAIPREEIVAAKRVLSGAESFAAIPVDDLLAAIESKDLHEGSFRN